jgi:hypothetical protein
MSTISLPSSVADILRRTTGPVQLVDEQGKVLGSFAPAKLSSEELTPEELAELKRRMQAPGPRYSTEEVLKHLDSLETRR